MPIYACHFVDSAGVRLTFESVTYLTIFDHTIEYKIFFVEIRQLLIDFLLTVKAATLIFIPGRGSAISSAKEGKSGFIYNLVKT